MESSVNTLFSAKSRGFAPCPTDGAAGGTDFNARLDVALAQLGLDNARFAARLGPTGQQLVHNWRTRGRIGRSSFGAVRRALPGVSMDWLNDGHGERATTLLDPEIVAGAYIGIAARFERAGLVYSVALDPDLLVGAVRAMAHPTPAAERAVTDAIGSRISHRRSHPPGERRAPARFEFAGAERRAG